MKVEVETLAELDQRFERFLGAAETVGLRLSRVQGDGRVQEYFTREEEPEYLRSARGSWTIPSPREFYPT